MLVAKLYYRDIQGAPVALIPVFAESVVTPTAASLEAAHSVLVLIGSSEVKTLFLSTLRAIMIGVASGDVESEVSPSDSSSEVMYIQSSLISGGRSAGVILFAGSVWVAWIARDYGVHTIAVCYVFGSHR